MNATKNDLAMWVSFALANVALMLDHNISGAIWFLGAFLWWFIGRKES